MVLKVEVQGIGEFDIKHDYLHRGRRPRLVTYDKGDHKELQFNTYDKGEDYDFDEEPWQDGYDHTGNEIKIKVIERS